MTVRNLFWLERSEFSLDHGGVAKQWEMPHWQAKQIGEHILHHWQDGNYYTHMAEPTTKYVVVSKSCKNPEAAFKIISYLIANEQQWTADGITSTEMSAADLYPLWNVYDNANEIEVSTETLEKYPISP